MNSMGPSSNFTHGKLVTLAQMTKTEIQIYFLSLLTLLNSTLFILRAVWVTNAFFWLVVYLYTTFAALSVLSSWFQCIFIYIYLTIWKKLLKNKNKFKKDSCQLDTRLRRYFYRSSPTEQIPWCRLL